MPADALVRANNELLPGVWEMRLRASPALQSSKPGQFVMVRCGDGSDPLLRRPLSIHRICPPDEVVLLFGKVGRGTAWLSGRRAGERLDLMGPLGKGYDILPGAIEILLVAGGLGLAPLAFLAQEAIRMGKKVSIIQGAGTAAELCPRDRIPQGVSVNPITEDGSGGRKGLATSLIPDLISQADQVFSCGPEAMYRAMAAMECLDGKPVQISLEERMACGVGACYGCTVRTRSGPRQVCRDGPVFGLHDIDWRGADDGKECQD